MPRPRIEGLDDKVPVWHWKSDGEKRSWWSREGDQREDYFRWPWVWLSVPPLRRFGIKDWHTCIIRFLFQANHGLPAHVSPAFLRKLAAFSGPRYLSAILPDLILCPSQDLHHREIGHLAQLFGLGMSRVGAGRRSTLCNRPKWDVRLRQEYTTEALLLYNNLSNATHYFCGEDFCTFWPCLLLRTKDWIHLTLGSSRRLTRHG